MSGAPTGEHRQHIAQIAEGHTGGQQHPAEFQTPRAVAFLEDPKRTDPTLVPGLSNDSLAHGHIIDTIPGRVCCPGKCLLTAQGQCFVRFSVSSIEGDG